MHEEIKIVSDEDGRQWLSKTIFNDDGSEEYWNCYTLPTSFDSSLYTSLQDYINWLKIHSPIKLGEWKLLSKMTKREVEIQLLCRCHLSRILHEGWYEKAYGVHPTSWEQIIAEMEKFRHFATHEMT